jgi:hypothetical protein
MPTYTNSGRDNKYGEGSVLFRGKSAITSQHYFRSLPTGVTLTSHEPIVQPWALLTAGEDGLIDVSAWDNIVVYNGGDDTATISANSDDSSAITIMPSSKESWNNVNGIFGCLEVLTGTGVLVWGTR